jgi:hypothetical protein
MTARGKALWIPRCEPITRGIISQRERYRHHAQQHALSLRTPRQAAADRLPAVNSQTICLNNTGLCKIFHDQVMCWRAESLIIFPHPGPETTTKKIFFN